VTEQDALDPTALSATPREKIISPALRHHLVVTEQDALGPTALSAIPREKIISPALRHHLVVAEQDALGPTALSATPRETIPLFLEVTSPKIAQNVTLSLKCLLQVTFASGASNQVQ
jgi:hypothetical protein